jgi:hypothetical protein
MAGFEVISIGRFCLIAEALAGCEELVPFKYSPLAFGLDLGTLTETFLHALSILIFSMIETFKFATGLQSPET